MILGQLIVNVPVLAILFGPAIALDKLGSSALVLPAFAVSFFVAWSWWSFFLPRWRLWAYERVPSTGELHILAVGVGLAWPRGSFAERTEFQSDEMRRRVRQLERRFP